MLIATPETDLDSVLGGWGPDIAAYNCEPVSIHRRFAIANLGW